MEFRELTNERHSVRLFDTRAVTDGELRWMLEVAGRAPSAGGLQSYSVVVVRDEARRHRLSEAAHEQRSLTHAPVVLVFCADAGRSSSRYGQRGAELFSIQDATLAAAYAQLAAQDIGLSSVWVGAFDERAVREVLHATPQLRPVCLLALGHPAERPPAHVSRPLHEIVRREQLDGRAW